ncbi:hypothetical protein [Halorussus amylolyticus]|uniref:hypothetical protein n=1 Tax=Halorussus amylolyticus TaxID=1126242 RepID=UPI001EE42269|nr:hypothetical protein [Halorussus amylolyticus]
MTYIDKSESLGGFGQAFVNGAGGLVVAFFTIVIGIGEAFAGLIISPTDAFASVTADSIEAMFGAPAGFIQDAWNTAAVALGMDPWLQLGPFVIMVASGAFVGGIAIPIYYLDLTDADTITGINLPFVGLEDGGDLDNEEE